MNGSQHSRPDQYHHTMESVSAIEGLPPLPKGLSGILNSSGGSWRDIEKEYSKRTRIQADITKSRVSSGDALGRSSKPASLDAALAVLRKEMVGLRQLDMSLLCQLWSLYEAIQEYKGASLSDSTFTAENGYSEEEDEEEEDEDEEDRPGGGGPADTSLSLPPTQNLRDQWIKDSFHIPI